ncbi:hypothetical protein NDU88_002160 [Pleurodeles waltl]|uniref:ribonuclease H n=1 Tax=Pleurodeles waltl TaxID=8319 RepID=A0AAV7LBN9_PLEWA|nr:hypothetical protein NDU88_002160 [Pleurodeles waltl]
MMEAMHSFMASAKAIAGLGADEQSASSRRAGAGQVWGQDTNGTPTAQGDASALGAGVADGVSLHTAAGGSDRANSVRPDPPLLSGRSSLAWRVPLEARERIWKREFIDIFSLLTFAKEGTDITVPSKEVDKHKWKRKVKPEESIDNWLEAFAMLSTVIMEKFPEQGPALCKYNRVIYEEYTRNGGTGWLNYDREFRQKMEQAPEMAWDCREIELWVQYMGNGGRPASSDSAFTKHKQARPFYFKQHTLAHILKDYPRPSERVMLFRGFSEGFRIPYAGPSVTREANNLQSAKEAPGIVQEKLEMELQLGRVAGPFACPPLPNFIVSPLGIVPKKELGKYRMIHHLSYPKGASVNDYLEEGSCSVGYASFDEAVDLVRAAGIGALMAKADIESAFRLLPVHPGSFHILGMKWAGQYFYDKCMPMGCAVSCSLFETFACFLEWALKEQKPPGSSLHYLDDFLFIGKAGSDECRATLNAFEHLSRALGVPLAPEKTQGPSECLTFLGIEIDSTSGICRLPEDKYEELLFAVTFSLAFFGAFRASELVANAKSDTSYRALKWGDLKLGVDMIELRVRHSKTDQKGMGVLVRLRGFEDPKCCPVELLRRRLMTPRPICNEDGRDVRGRRGGKAEARTKRGVAAGRLLVGLISCGKNKRY